MTGTHLFDRLANDSRLPLQDADEAEKLRELGEGMVDAAIMSGKMLREHRMRMFPVDDHPESMAVAKTLQAEFQQWVQEADAVYERAVKLHSAGHTIANLAELNDLLGFTQAMLQVSPEDHVQTMKEVGHGKPMTMEELRRELHLPPSAEFRASLASLAPWLQEDTLDELELLIANPTKLIMRQGNDFCVHDFVRKSGGRSHYVFLRVTPNHSAGILTLVSLGHVERP